MKQERTEFSKGTFKDYDFKFYKLKYPVGNGGIPMEDGIYTYEVCITKNDEYQATVFMRNAWEEIARHVIDGMMEGETKI